jgi:hypothetical protein
MAKAKVSPEGPRTLLRIDPLQPVALFDYLEKNWLSTNQKMQAGIFKIADGTKLHNLRMEVLNQRGLFGLNGTF